MLFAYHKAPLQGIGNLRRSVAYLSAGESSKPISFRIVFPARRRGKEIRACGDNRNGTMTLEVVTVDDLSRFEGEGGLEIPVPVTELIDVPLEKAACGESHGQRIRKQVYELTLNDHRAFQVREFRL